MKKYRGFLICFLFCLVGFATAEAREVAVLNKEGEQADEMGITREPAINKDRVLVDDFEDGNFKNRLDGDSGAWNLDEDETNASCVPEILTVPSPELSTKILKLTYDVDSPTKAQNGYWMKLRNTDLTGYDHLEFLVKGDKDSGFTTTFKIEIKKYKDKERTEKLTGHYTVQNVGSTWQRVSIPMGKFNAIQDWKEMDELVIVFHDRICDVKTGTLYFDNIQFVKTTNPGPTAFDFRGSKIRKTYRDFSAKEWGQWLASRLKGYPKEVFVQKEFSKNDRKFLLEIARDTWRFFDEIVDKNSHLPLDTIAFSENGIFEEGGYVGDYTNVTNIGLYFVCIVAANDFGFITKEEAIKRIMDTMGSVERMETYRNFLFNYYDTTTMERTSNFVSLIDSGWLTIGVKMAKLAFPDEKELVEKANKLLKGWDYSFFYNPVDELFYHGYFTNIEAYSNYNYGAFYSEPRIISYLAIAKGQVPKEHWFRLNRTFDETYSWQGQTPIGRTEKEFQGIKYFGGHYEYEGDKYVPSWGGSLFEALMPALFLDEKGLAPKSLGRNNYVHAKIHATYPKEKLNYLVWGMSPSSVPEGGYSEYGVKPLGLKGYPAGAVTPHVSFLALEYVPKKAIANLRALIRNYKVYGEYGFYDAVNPETGKVALKYLCLDQGMIFLALDNYLNKGILRKRFHSDPEMKSAEYLLTGENILE